MKYNQQLKKQKSDLRQGKYTKRTPYSIINKIDESERLTKHKNEQT